MLRVTRPETMCRLWAVWLMLLIAVLGAVVPTISHGLVRAADVPLVEICTSLGPRWVAIADSSISPESSNGQESALRIEHCPFCLHTPDHAMPPPCVAFQGLDIVGEHLVRMAEQGLILGWIAVRMPPPRGPPV